MYKYLRYVDVLHVRVCVFSVCCVPYMCVLCTFFMHLYIQGPREIMYLFLYIFLDIPMHSYISLLSILLPLFLYLSLFLPSLPSLSPSPPPSHSLYIKVWGLTAGSPHFSLEGVGGHERGVNCIDYYPGV